MLKTYHQDEDSSIGSESFHFCLFLLFFSICSFIGKMRMDPLALTSTFSVCCGKIGESESGVDVHIVVHIVLCRAVCIASIHIAIDLVVFAKNSGHKFHIFDFFYRNTY